MVPRSLDGCSRASRGLGGLVKADGWRMMGGSVDSVDSFSFSKTLPALDDLFWIVWSMPAVWHLFGSCRFDFCRV